MSATAAQALAELDRGVPPVEVVERLETVAPWFDAEYRRFFSNLPIEMQAERLRRDIDRVFGRLFRTPAAFARFVWRVKALIGDVYLPPPEDDDARYLSDAELRMPPVRSSIEAALERQVYNRVRAAQQTVYEACRAAGAGHVDRDRHMAAFLEATDARNAAVDLARTSGSTYAYELGRLADVTEMALRACPLDEYLRRLGQIRYVTVADVLKIWEEELDADEIAPAREALPAWLRSIEWHGVEHRQLLELMRGTALVPPAALDQLKLQFARLALEVVGDAVEAELWPAQRGVLAEAKQLVDDAIGGEIRQGERIENVSRAVVERDRPESNTAHQLVLNAVRLRDPSSVCLAFSATSWLGVPRGTDVSRDLIKRAVELWTNVVEWARMRAAKAAP